MTFGMDPAATAAADEALTIALAAYARAAGAPTYANALAVVQAARTTFPNLGADVTSGARVLAFLEEQVAGVAAVRAGIVAGLRGVPDERGMVQIRGPIPGTGDRSTP